MSAPRNVTVPTPDGPVVLPEPDWCVQHGTDRLNHRVFTHYGDDFHINVDTPGGPRALLAGFLQQRPLAREGATTDVVYALELADGDSVAYDPEQLRAVYRSIVDQARALLDRADQLEVIRGGER